jgi:hypothetical protein
MEERKRSFNYAHVLDSSVFKELVKPYNVNESYKFFDTYGTLEYITKYKDKFKNIVLIDIMSVAHAYRHTNNTTDGFVEMEDPETGEIHRIQSGILFGIAGFVKKVQTVFPESMIFVGSDLADKTEKYRTIYKSKHGGSEEGFEIHPSCDPFIHLCASHVSKTTDVYHVYAPDKEADDVLNTLGRDIINRLNQVDPDNNVGVVFISDDKDLYAQVDTRRTIALMTPKLMAISRGKEAIPTPMDSTLEIFNALGVLPKNLPYLRVLCGKESDGWTRIIPASLAKVFINASEDWTVEEFVNKYIRQFNGNDRIEIIRRVNETFSNQAFPIIRKLDHGKATMMSLFNTNTNKVAHAK